MALYGIPSFSTLGIKTQTTPSETSVTIPWGTLPAVGDAILYSVRIWGQQNNGQRGFYRSDGGSFVRNALGAAADDDDKKASRGYTNTSDKPWKTANAPTGWSANAKDLLDNDIRVSFTGAADQTVIWYALIEYHLIGSARILVVTT